MPNRIGIKRMLREMTGWAAKREVKPGLSIDHSLHWLGCILENISEDFTQVFQSKWRSNSGGEVRNSLKISQADLWTAI